jgi:hypothetical protein
MRIKKELVILIIVIILLSAYLALRSRDRTHYSLPEISELSREEITKIEIARSEGSIFLQKEGDTWNIIPQKWPVEDYIVSNMLEAMEELKVTTLVSESKNYDRYGLSDNEKLIVRAWAGESLKREFEIGKKVPASQHTFIKLPDNHRVYHAQNEFRWKFDQTIEKLRAKTILAFEKEEVKEISITQNDKSYLFIPEKPSKEKDDTKSEGSPEEKTVWVDSNGEKWDEEKAEDLLYALSELNCKKFIDEDQKKDLKDPICDILIKGKQEYRLSIFSPIEDEGKGYPGISSESPYTFILSEEDAKKLMSATDKIPAKTDEDAG